MAEADSMFAVHFPGAENRFSALDLIEIRHCESCYIIEPNFPRSNVDEFRFIICILQIRLLVLLEP